MSNKNKNINNNNNSSIVNTLNDKEFQEIKNLNKISLKKEIYLKENLNKEEKELLEKQKKELDELVNNFDIKIRPKITSFFLQLKTREYFLCKQDRFIEAEETRQKAQKKYIEDNKHIDDEKKFKLYQKIEELNNKHRIEYMKFMKNKDKQIYYLKKEEDDKKNNEIIKFKKEKENEVMKKNIKYFIEQNNKKRKINKTDNNNFKKNKNNPWN